LAISTLKLGIFFTLSLLISGCSNIYSTDSGGEPYKLATAALPTAQINPLQILNRSEPTPTVEEAVTPELLASINIPFLAVTLLDQARSGQNAPWAGFLLSGDNKDVITWVDGTARTISLTQTGFVRATRGYGRDLMVADSADLESVFVNFEAFTKLDRIHWLLDGSNQSQALALVCEKTRSERTTLTQVEKQYQTLYFEERCLDQKGNEIVNKFWFEAKTRSFIKSEQWISPEIGRLRFQRLNL